MEISKGGMEFPKGGMEISKGGYGNFQEKVKAAAIGIAAHRPSECAPVFFSLVVFFGCEQIRKTQDEPQWIVTQRLLSHLQYLDATESSTGDLSPAPFNITSSR